MNHMDGANSEQGRSEKFIQDSCSNSQKEETTGKT